MSWAPKDLAQSGRLDELVPVTPGGELARWTRAAVMPVDLMDEVSSNGALSNRTAGVISGQPRGSLGACCAAPDVTLLAP